MITVRHKVIGRITVSEAYCVQSLCWCRCVNVLSLFSAEAVGACEWLRHAASQQHRQPVGVDSFPWHWSWAAPSIMCPTSHQSNMADGFWLHWCSVDARDVSLRKVWQ